MALPVLDVDFDEFALGLDVLGPFDDGMDDWLLEADDFWLRDADDPAHVGARYGEMPLPASPKLCRADIMQDLCVQLGRAVTRSRVADVRDVVACIREQQELHAAAPVTPEDKALERRVIEALHTALRAGDWDMATELLRLRKLASGATTAHLVCALAPSRGVQQAVQLVRDAGSREPGTLNAADDSGWTPLLMACARGSSQLKERIGVSSRTNPALVNRLLRMRGLDTSAVDESGRTAVHHVCSPRTPSAPTLRRLIAAGAPVDVRDNEGVTALHLACERAHMPTVNTLLQTSRGALCASARDARGRTPLLAACDSGSCKAYDVVYRLVQTTSARDTVGDAEPGTRLTPFIAACSFDDLQSARYLAADERVNVASPRALSMCLGFLAARRRRRQDARIAPQRGRTEHGRGTVEFLLSVPELVAKLSSNFLFRHVVRSGPLRDKLQSHVRQQERWNRRKALLVLRLLAETKRGRIHGGQRWGRRWEVTCEADSHAATARATASTYHRVADRSSKASGTRPASSGPSPAKRRRRGALRSVDVVDLTQCSDGDDDVPCDSLAMSTQQAAEWLVALGRAGLAHAEAPAQRAPTAATLRRPPRPRAPPGCRPRVRTRPTAVGRRRSEDKTWTVLPTDECLV